MQECMPLWSAVADNDNDNENDNDNDNQHYHDAGVYAVVECSCHVSLAVSIFLTVGLSVERFQASSLKQNLSF